MTLIYDVSRQWSLYLNRCVAALESESLEAPGSNTPLSIYPILLELEGGCYVGPIFPGPFADLLVILSPDEDGSNVGGGSGSGSGGGNGGGRGSGSGGGGGGGVKIEKGWRPWGGREVWVRYNAHLTALSIWYMENSRTLLEGIEGN